MEEVIQEIIQENVLEGKYKSFQIERAHWVLRTMVKNRPTLRHIIVKYQNNGDKKQDPKTGRGKEFQAPHKIRRNTMASDFLNGNTWSKKRMGVVLSKFWGKMDSYPKSPNPSLMNYDIW